MGDVAIFDLHQANGSADATVRCRTCAKDIGVIPDIERMRKDRHFNQIAAMQNAFMQDHMHRHHPTIDPA